MVNLQSFSLSTTKRRWLSVMECMNYLQCSRSGFYLFARHYQIPRASVKGIGIRYDVEAIDECLQKWSQLPVEFDFDQPIAEIIEKVVQTQ